MVAIGTTLVLVEETTTPNDLAQKVERLVVKLNKDNQSIIRRYIISDVIYYMGSTTKYL